MKEQFPFPAVWKKKNACWHRTYHHLPTTKKPNPDAFSSVHFEGKGDKAMHTNPLK